MPEPQLTEPEEKPDSEELEAPVEGDTEELEEVSPEDIETIELDDNDLIDGGFFTGTESSQEDGFEPEFDTEEQTDSADDAIGEKADKALGLDDEQSNVETVINEGAARLAVVGLEQEYKLGKSEDIAESECLEAEFYGVFETFRLGHFGAGFLDTYIFVDDEPVDPAWGLLGAVLCGCAMTVWMRPDGDEIIEDAKDALTDIGGTN